MALDPTFIPGIAASFRAKQEEPWPDEENAPPTLFHYTSAEGLVGIVTSRKFFLTDVLSSSDRSEIVYGSGLAQAALTDHVGHPLCDLILAAYRGHPLQNLGETYFLHAVCFCPHPDVLTQWRAFSTAGGFALGVDFAKIYKRGEAGEFAVTKILYDEARQKEILREAVRFSRETYDHFKPEAAKMLPEDRQLLLNELVVQSAMLLLTSIVRFKHPAFASEEEWRVLRLDPPVELSGKLRYRMSGPRLIPYIELPFEPDLITNIVRSPGLWPASTDYAVRRLAASLGPHVKVTQSDLPL